MKTRTWIILGGGLYWWFFMPKKRKATTPSSTDNYISVGACCTSCAQGKGCAG